MEQFAIVALHCIACQILRLLSRSITQTDFLR